MLLTGFFFCPRKQLLFQKQFLQKPKCSKKRIFRVYMSSTLACRFQKSNRQQQGKNHSVSKCHYGKMNTIYRKRLFYSRHIFFIRTPPIRNEYSHKPNFSTHIQPSVKKLEYSPPTEVSYENAGICVFAEQIYLQ